jgi:3-hydroxyacyl-CoA dehydrogenase
MDKNNSSTVKLLQEGEIGIIEIDYPPVNALSQSVRLGIVNGIDTFANTASVKAIIIRCY